MDLRSGFMGVVGMDRLRHRMYIARSAIAHTSHIYGRGHSGAVRSLYGKVAQSFVTAAWKKTVLTRAMVHDMASPVQSALQDAQHFASPSELYGRTSVNAPRSTHTLTISISPGLSRADYTFAHKHRKLFAQPYNLCGLLEQR